MSNINIANVNFSTWTFVNISCNDKTNFLHMFSMQWKVTFKETALNFLPQDIVTKMQTSQNYNYTVCTGIKAEIVRSFNECMDDVSA